MAARGVVTPENKAEAEHVRRAFGGTPRVTNYADDDEKRFIDIVLFEDRPWAGVTSYSTLRLAEHAMYQDGEEFPTRLELAGACASSSELFPNALVTAALIIGLSNRLYSPGSVIPGCVSEYYPDSTVPHLYLTAPFLWEDSLTTLDCGPYKVSWLLAVPISETERAYSLRHGDEALEDLFEARQIDIFDLWRAPVA